MKNRIRAVLLCLALVIPLVISASSVGRTSLFVGDGAWNGDALLPFIEADGKKLVPVSAFAEIGGIEITSSETLGSVLLCTGDEFLSLNLNFGTCLDENGNVSEFHIYRYGGEIYVEPAAICEKFALKFETAYLADGYLSARITDGNETLTFDQLASLYASTSVEKNNIYLYNPAVRTLEGVFMNTVIILPAAANTAMLCRLLGNHGATFVIDPDNIANYASVITSVIASGHSIAYYMDAQDMETKNSVASFASSMEKANELLYSLTGSTTRIFVSTELYNKMPQIDGFFGKSCRMNLIAEDLQSERIVNMTLSESPEYEVYNYSLGGDAETRQYYTDFFKKFDSYKDLVSAPMTVASAVQ